MELLKAGGTDNSVRVLVVDEFAPWQTFVSTMLQKHLELRIIGRASDGLAAVRNAEELHPDLILLEIGLPLLNGIEVARRIRELSPTSKILFVSENRSVDIVERALNTAAEGYVIKADVASELLPAIKVVLGGKRFISPSLAGHFLVATTLSMTGTIFSWALTLISGIH